MKCLFIKFYGGELEIAECKGRTYQRKLKSNDNVITSIGTIRDIHKDYGEYVNEKILMESWRKLLLKK